MNTLGEFDSLLDEFRSVPDGFEALISQFNNGSLVLEPTLESQSYSGTQYEIIKKYIREFQASLDEEHDVGLLLTNFGQSILMEVTSVSYEQSVLMVFRGKVNGNEATLIQHVSQLNFLLTAISKEPEQPKRKIGFSAD